MVVTKPLRCFKMLRKLQSPLAFSNMKCEIPLLHLHVSDEGEGRDSYACMLHVFCNAEKGDAESAHIRMACCQRSYSKHFELGDILPWVVSFVNWEENICTRDEKSHEKREKL